MVNNRVINSILLILFVANLTAAGLGLFTFVDRHNIGNLLVAVLNIGVALLALRVSYD